MRGLIGMMGLAGALGAASSVRAHGLIEDPPSRQWICGAETKPNEIDFGKPKTPACSTAFNHAPDPQAAYNFMAVVTHTWGLSKANPLPAHVCGYAGEYWKGALTPWDVPMEWPANAVSAGPKTITWNISWGPHFDDTKEFKYWITKADFQFSPSKELTWDDFEKEPFCSLDYDDTKPTANPNVVADKTTAKFMTKCTLPARGGHHVVYGEWGRTEPTIERFHGCFDAQFGTTAVRIPYRLGGASPAKSGAEVPMGSDLLGRSRELGRPGILPIAPALSK